MEVELETTQLNCRENMHQAVLAERERFTQMQWDIEELRRKCMDMEMKWKSEEVRFGFLVFINIAKHSFLEALY